MLLIEKTLKEFAEIVASDSPAPGGGSVSALSSALGSSLALMACKISLKKQPNEQLAALLPVLEVEQKKLLDLIDEDTRAFDEVMHAFKLPKTTDEEKTARSTAIQGAFKKAALAPLETMRSSAIVLEACATAKTHCAQSVASDVTTAIAVTRAGFTGAQANVEINLSAIKDQEFVSKTKEECVELSKRMKI